MADEFETVEELQQQLRECNANLNRAALAGKQLLEENQQLAERYDLDMEECNKRIESLEQAKYTLQMQLESKDHMEKHYEAELGNASERTKREVAAVTERLKMSHANELQKTSSQNDSLKADLELLKLKETQLQEKIQCLEGRLEQAEAVNSKTFMDLNSTTMEDQVATLLEQASQLEVEKLLLTDKLMEKDEICKQQEMTISSSNRRMEELQEIMEDRHEQCLSFQRALEECRERLEEKQAELDLFRLESQDPNRKGNSLFAEVEVKRQEIEKKFISLSVQFESTKKRANFHKQRVQELKLQVANLLQTDDGRVSINQVKEVQQALVRTRQQNQALLLKLNESEGNSAGKIPQSHQTDKSAKEGTAEGGLAFLLDQSKKETEKLRKELKTERMMRMTSETKESEYQARLNDLKKELDKSKAIHIKLELKLSDLKEKIKTKGNLGSTTTLVHGGNIEKVSIAKKTPSSQADENKTTVSDCENKENLPTPAKIFKGDDEIQEAIGGMDQMGQGNDNDASVVSTKDADHLRGEKRQSMVLVKDEETDSSEEPKTKKVSISDEVEVIESNETVEDSVQEDTESHDRRASLKHQAKKARGRVVYVNKSSQNECKQQ